MPQRTEYAPGTPNWIDLQTTDQADAKQFYGELFGWTYDDLPMGDQGVYSIAVLKGERVAAIAPLGDQAAAGVPPHWNSYVSVSDVDATMALVEPGGGTVVMEPFDVMDAGRMGVMMDPTGAMIAAWQPKNNIGAGIVNEAGAYSWNELLTPDVPKAVEFYNKVFGWSGGAVEGMEYTEFKLNGESIAGAMNPPMPGIPPAWTIYFSTDDTDATVDKAKSLGAAVFAEPMDIPPGRFAALADPQGAMFSVIKMAS
jgi:uncharacterized protein